MTFTSPPLGGLKVLDLSRILAGPYCTQLLADAGAEVVKVEPPAGDDTRRFGPPFVGGESTYFLSANRGKRSIAVDLRRAEGQDLVLRLAAWCDVVVANFRPGDAAKLGVDYAALSARNAQLIYATVSGFGMRGDARWAHKLGYDLVLQGMGGAPSLTGAPDGPPYKSGTSIADLVAGLNAYGAIMTALWQRERTGAGAHLDISIYEGQLSMLSYHASAWLNAGAASARMGNAHPSICPYETFAAQDGHFNLACATDAQFARLCEVLPAPELARDARFSTNAERVHHRDELVPRLQALFDQHPVSHWVQRCEQAGIPCGPLATVPEALAHPQVAARHTLVSLPHASVGSVHGVGSPMGLGRASFATLPPPRLSEHAYEIMNLAGLAHAEMDALVATGVVVAPPASRVAPEPAPH